MPNSRPLRKSDYEALSEFRYQLRRFLRFSEEAAQSEGITPRQYHSLSKVFAVARISAFNDRE